MPRNPDLQPDSQFPKKAIDGSKQVFPSVDGTSASGSALFTWDIASAADAITAWGRNVQRRDYELREFWPTETFLAGAFSSVCFNRASMDWEIRSPSEKVNQAVTDMLKSAIAGPEIGWTPFELRGTQDLYGTDNGRFIELIRDPGLDATSKFKEQKAPVIGIGHLDSNQCQRTGNPEYPIIYTDRNGKMHKLKWYEVIPFSEFPSPIEKMNGVGVCALSRCLKIAQIMRSIMIYKDEKISGRQFKAMHLVSGVSRSEIKDEMQRGQEEANNQGAIRFIMPSIVASLDPEKPVSVATIELASLPDGFDYDVEMKWYISGLALSFAVDYQEFAPLPGGNIGSSSQSQILHRKATAKGPSTYMRRMVEAFKAYGVLPRGVSLVYTDVDEQEELEKQAVRTSAMEEAAISVRSGILPPEAARKDLARRHIYDQATVAGIASDYGNDIVAPKQMVGGAGGNTIEEDAGRQTTGKQNETAGGRLRKGLKDYFEATLQETRMEKSENLLKKAMEDMNVTVNVPQQLPPQVTVNVPPAQVTVNIPKQDVPDIKVNVPAPNVTVNIPKVKKERQIVNRDSEGNIKSTDKVLEYE
jgi:hypothetical protein